MAREVTGPDGITWKVRRRVFDASVTPRWRGADDHPSFIGRWLSPSPFTALEGGLGMAWILVALFVLPVLFAYFFFPVAFLLAEAAVFAVLASARLFGRVVLRRPWRVEAWSSDGDRCFWLVGGYRDAGDAIGPIAAALRNGLAPPAVAGATGPSAMTRRLPRRRRRR